MPWTHEMYSGSWTDMAWFQLNILVLVYHFSTHLITIHFLTCCPLINKIEVIDHLPQFYSSVFDLFKSSYCELLLFWNVKKKFQWESVCKMLLKHVTKRLNDSKIFWLLNKIEICVCHGGLVMVSGLPCPNMLVCCWHKVTFWHSDGAFAVSSFTAVIFHQRFVTLFLLRGFVSQVSPFFEWLC